MMDPEHAAAPVPPACDDVAGADLTALARALVDAALEARERVLEVRLDHGPQRSDAPVRRGVGA